MKPDITKFTLPQLEEYYAGLLEKVRDLIEDTGGDVAARKTPEEENTPPLPSRNTIAGSAGNVNGSAAKTEFKNLKKGDAAEIVFKESQDEILHKRAVFEEFQRRGHTASNIASLTSTMSSDPRFVSLGDGLWRLAQPDLSPVNGRDKDAST